MAFKESYAGLSDSQLTESGVTGTWSVKDLIAHVTWWEEEALKHLPLIIKGGTPPRYSTKYGGIDAFNAANKSITHQLGVKYINITDISRRGLTEPDLVAFDGLHPSGKMYSEWIQRIMADAKLKFSKDGQEESDEEEEDDSDDDGN